MCYEHIERKETTAGGEKERKEETRMGCREGQSLWQPHPEVVRRPLDWLLGGHWRWKRRGFSKVVASSALQMGQAVHLSEASCLWGWWGLGCRSHLGTESRMITWDAGKPALERPGRKEQKQD